jgi:DNA mismatch repair protein MutL
VVVRDLFYCVPARRKFLRKAETELAYITDHFLRISLANPAVHMQLQSQEKVVCDHPGCETLLHRAAQVLGPEIVKSLRGIDFENAAMSVSGFLAPPDVQRTNSQSLFLYVNGRAVWDRLLQRAVLTAYEALLPRGKYPVAVVFIGISAAQVDVNVHPAKREIRFRNPGEVISTVRTALFEALSAVRSKSYGFSQAPGKVGIASEGQAPFGSVNPFQRKQSIYAPRASWGGAPPAGEIFPVRQTELPSLRDETPAGTSSYSSLNLIGQLANLFILLEAPEGLVLIDQHAAHERIVFSGLNKKKANAAQLLARPAIIDLLPKEAALLETLVPSLRDIGFEIEHFGGSSFAVHAVPASLSGFKPEEIVRDYLRYAEEECPANEGEIMLGLARIASCHGSVRAGQRLKPEEIRHLLEALDAIDTPFTCPHGRPLSYTLTYEQILRFFKRS